MNTGMIIAIGKETVTTLLLMAAPMLLTGAIIGVLISMVQTVTQLKDQSLTFIPKIVGVVSVLVISTPFLINTIVQFSRKIFFLVEQLGKIGIQ